MVNHAKKLPCGHIFHTTCLRSWFQRQQTCPTCRLNILRAPTTNSTAIPRPEDAAAAAAVAPGAVPNVAPNVANVEGVREGAENIASTGCKYIWFYHKNNLKLAVGGIK